VFSPELIGRSSIKYSALRKWKKRFHDGGERPKKFYADWIDSSECVSQLDNDSLFSLSLPAREIEKRVLKCVKGNKRMEKETIST
jgi:hypothetical protein